MRVVTLYKKVADEEVIAVVPFDKEHIEQLQAEGYYQRSKKQYNKHGIPVVS